MSLARGAPRAITDEDVERVIVKTLEETPLDATHWSSRLGQPDAPVAVVIGRLLLRRRWHRLLHDHSAGQIQRALADLDHIRVEFVDIPVYSAAN
jgi:hypothetical protein